VDTPPQRRKGTRRRHPALPIAYVAIGLLSALGGARPTGLEAVDAVLLGLGGAAAAACGVRARSTTLYIAAGAAAICQPDPLPLLLAIIGLLAVLARTFVRGRTLMGALGGGLAWAATVGAPLGSPARPVIVPLVAIAAMAWSSYRAGSRGYRQRFRRVVVVTCVVLGIAAATGLLAVVAARNSVERGADLLDRGLQQAREGDTEAAVESLRSARVALADTDSTLGAPWAMPSWVVPGLSQNVRALHDIVVEVDELAAVAITTAAEADVQDLGPADGRIDLEAIAAVEEPLVGALERLHGARDALAEVGDAWLLPPVRDRLEDVQDELDDALPDAELALEGVRLAPAMFGGGGESTYLVLFTTPVEARATSGFPGNYAEVTFTDGRFEMVEFGRISELNDALGAGGTISGPEDFLRRWSPFGPQQEWRNLTLSPDFPTVAAVAGELYPQSGGRPLDGVMTVNPYALAALMRFTGEVHVPGLEDPIDSDYAAEFLLRDQYALLPDVPDRTDALEILAETTFDRLAGADLPGPRDLGRVFGPVVAQGHLQVASFADGAPSFLDGVGVSGRFPEVDGDLLAVTTSNAAGNKIDLFARRTVDYAVEWDPSTGALEATVTITLANDAPETGLPDYVIGNVLSLRPDGPDLPVGWNSSLLSVYTPHLVQEATLDGEPVRLQRNVEAGVQALSTFVSVPPGGHRTLVIRLAGSFEGPTYELDLLGQPMVTPDQASVSVMVAGGGRVDTTGPIAPAGPGTAAGDFDLAEPRHITVER
jgi:hypothetical protein